MSTSKKRILAYLVIFFSLFISLRLIKDIYRLRKLDNRLIIARLELDQAKNEEKKLQGKIKKVEKYGWWEKQVRDKLKMARPIEKIVIIPDELIEIAKEFNKIVEKEDENLSNFKKWIQLFIY